MDDFTQQIVDFLSSRFSGHEVFQPLMTYIDNTRDVPIIGRSGDEIKARGSVRIGNLLSHEGSVKRLEVANFTLWVTEPFFKVTFEYTSQTHGERWLWPGGLFVDNVWDDVRPGGTITGILTMIPQQNAVLRLEISVSPGHDDRPNNFIKDRVAPQTIGKLDALLEEFTGKSVNT